MKMQPKTLKIISWVGVIVSFIVGFIVTPVLALQKGMFDNTMGYILTFGQSVFFIFFMMVMDYSEKMDKAQNSQEK